MTFFIIFFFTLTIKIIFSTGIHIFPTLYLKLYNFILHLVANFCYAVSKRNSR